MAKGKDTPQDKAELKKQVIIEQLWLTYYNDTLFAKGLITEDERNRMVRMIQNRTSAKMR